MKLDTHGRVPYQHLTEKEREALHDWCRLHDIDHTIVPVDTRIARVGDEWEVDVYDQRDGKSYLVPGWAPTGLGHVAPPVQGRTAMEEAVTDIDALARAGDWDGVKREIRAQHDRMMAELDAEREARAQRYRESPDPRMRASQACRDGDPNWRDLMPLSWHISRWWDIHSVPLVMTAAIIGGAVALFWWLT